MPGARSNDPGAATPETVAQTGLPAPLRWSDVRVPMPTVDYLARWSAATEGR
jgi:hypothetical protein